MWSDRRSHVGSYAITARRIVLTFCRISTIGHYETQLLRSWGNHIRVNHLHTQTTNNSSRLDTSLQESSLTRWLPYGKTLPVMFSAGRRAVSPPEAADGALSLSPQGRAGPGPALSPGVDHSLTHFSKFEVLKGPWSTARSVLVFVRLIDLSVWRSQLVFIQTPEKGFWTDSNLLSYWR